MKTKPARKVTPTAKKELTVQLEVFEQRARLVAKLWKGQAARLGLHPDSDLHTHEINTLLNCADDLERHLLMPTPAAGRAA